MVRIGIDIGGAFTDLVVYDPETGKMEWVKTETTPYDYSQGVLECIRKAKFDLGRASMIIHGQTLVINTIIERKGAKVGLITTKGFRDVIEIQRSNRRDIYNFRYKKPDPIIPRYLRLEVEERIMSNGKILKELNVDELKKATAKLMSEGVESIVVSFINSYANPIHEEKAGEIIKAQYPNIYLTLSNRVTREWREYERTMTAVLNAYTMPKLASYLGNLERAFSSLGFKGNFFIMTSSGGSVTSQFAKNFPILTMESGPIAGVVGSIAIAELLGLKNIITLDGGSTTTKASLIQDLKPSVTTEHYVERDRYKPGYPVFVPTVEILEVGNGGTSIAWIDETGNLRVGPKAAGAYPGPACYNKGGEAPTVTDAYVITGLLNQEYLLGGALKIDKRLSEKAIRPIAEHYNISIEEAADGIVRLANENAVYVIRLVSVQKGYDPRDFALIAHGGAGPMFAPFIAKELEIKKIVIPCIPPGVFSAWGMLVTDIRHDLVYTNIIRLDKENSIDEVNKTYEEMEERMKKIFESENLSGDKIIILRYADMRYYGQEHTVKVEVMPGKISSKDINEIIKRFHHEHERKYAFRLEESPVEIVNFHVTGISVVKKASLSEVNNFNKSLNDSLIEYREVYSDGKFEKWPIYDRKLIPIDSKILGPAIIEDPTSTIIILKDQKAVIDKYGNIIISS